MMEHRGLRVLATLACVIVVVAGLAAAKALVVPIFVALFLSLLAVPPMRRLQTYGLPAWAAITIVITVASLSIVAITAVVGGTVTEFQAELPFYKQRINQMVLEGLVWLEARGIELAPVELTEMLDTGAIMGLVTNTAGELLGALSNLILVLLTMVFMLLEAHGLPRKLRLALGRPDADLRDFSLVGIQVQKYLAIKAWVSLLTGVLVGILVWVCGLDFVLLWALIAFLFNFVPNIGSVIAAIPAVMLALVQFGPGRALAVAIGYLVINMVIGNGLEPRMMGRRLGLSTLVVFLSMLFWGWIWGPIGMLLSVPMTVIVKIMLEHSDDLRWVAIMLAPADEDPPAVELPLPARVVQPVDASPPKE